MKCENRTDKPTTLRATSQLAFFWPQGKEGGNALGEPNPQRGNIPPSRRGGQPEGGITVNRCVVPLPSFVRDPAQVPRVKPLTQEKNEWLWGTTTVIR